MQLIQTSLPRLPCLACSGQPHLLSHPQASTILILILFPLIFP